MSSYQYRGVVARSGGPKFGDKILYLWRGKRHWVPSGQWLVEHGFDVERDVVDVSDELLLTYLPGQPVTRILKRTEAGEIGINNYLEAREASAAPLLGQGLEIGAGASPFPVPLHCEVQYGDMYSYDELLKNAYPGQPLHDIISPTIKTDLDTLAGIPDDSQHFIVACHVIEHTRDPIGAITKAYAKLRPGGHLVLVVPDKERTFDRNRDLTTLQHLVDDYERPDPERDKEHFRDFYANAEGFGVSPDRFEAHWREQWANQYSIHYHTWVYESFGETIAWTRANAAPYRNVWSHPTVTDGIEFYYTLTK